MKRLLPKLMGVALALAASAAASPKLHEVTYLGTVTAVAEASLDVMVIDERTQSESPMTFRISAQTQFYRGDHAMTVADVAITVRERIAVTINNDVPGNTALAVRLADHAHN